jgi:hypothetical protein
MSERGVKKKLLGVVVAHKTDKTAVVSVSRLKKHKAYQKYHHGPKTVPGPRSPEPLPGGRQGEDYRIQAHQQDEAMDGSGCSREIR